MVQSVTSLNGDDIGWRAKRALSSVQKRHRDSPLEVVVSPFSGAKQGGQLRLIQSLCDVSDEIGWVFDANRQPDRGVENTDFLADVSWNAGMGHTCGQASKRLGAAQAHRELEDLQRVQEFKSGGLAADNVERERRARATALPRENLAGEGDLF